MAEGKKSFVIYTSWKRWLDGLNLEQKGKWLDWMLSYTNDEHPDFPQDQAVMIACMMAQDTLKRDLQKYEQRCERTNRINEERKRKKEEQSQNNIDTILQRSRTDIVSDNDNDNVNDNVNVNDISNDIDNKKNDKEKASNEATHTYGEYKRIKLKDSQYKKLVDKFGENTTKLAITKLDEYVQSNNNKNKYKDFYLVLKKVIEEDWFHISKDVQSASDTNIDELVNEVRGFKGDDEYIEQVLSWKGIDADTIKKVLDAVNNEIVWETL